MPQPLERRMTLTRAIHHIALGVAMACAVPVFAGAADPVATPRSPAQYDQLARAVFAQLVGMNTTPAKGAAEAAEALAAGFKAAGFPGGDVLLRRPGPGQTQTVRR